MIKSLRPLFIATLLLPLSFSIAAAPINTALPPKVQEALKASKLQNDALSLVMLPVSGPGTPTVFNADVSVNPASTMKLVTTYAALEMLGPTHQWKTEFYTDGTLSNGVLRGNLYLKGGGDPKLNMERLWLLMRDLRANGVQQVTGDLVLDRSHFVRQEQAVPGAPRLLDGQPQGPAFRHPQRRRQDSGLGGAAHRRHPHQQPSEGAVFQQVHR
jgi:D-alanyl-D-alanine carboxypeptidase/D-alanyl-D-alanine-endopeptidase (penicillin-binding protein 4)